MDLRPPLLCLPPGGHSARRWAQALGSEAKQPPCPTSNAFPAKLSFATCHWTRSHTGIPQSVQQPEKTTGYKTALRPGPQPLPQPGGAGACPGGQPSYADLRHRQEQGLRCTCARPVTRRAGCRLMELMTNKVTAGRTAISKNAHGSPAVKHLGTRDSCMPCALGGVTPQAAP